MVCRWLRPSGGSWDSWLVVKFNFSACMWSVQGALSFVHVWKSRLDQQAADWDGGPPLLTLRIWTMTPIHRIYTVALGWFWVRCGGSACVMKTNGHVAVLQQLRTQPPSIPIATITRRAGPCKCPAAPTHPADACFNPWQPTATQTTAFIHRCVARGSFCLVHIPQIFPLSRNGSGLLWFNGHYQSSRHRILIRQRYYCRE